jgi:capsid protein
MSVIVDSAGLPVSSQSGYEGAQRSEQRTAFLAFPTNSRRELNTYTRKELARKRRALDANLGIFARICGKIGQHAVGKGIFPRPLTRDREWNELNRKRFEARAGNPLLYSVEETYDIWEDQRFAAETMVGDGEYFMALVSKDGQRRTQRLDIFEIESPADARPGRRLPGGGHWQDGVMTDGYDAPRAYGVRELPREPWGWRMGETVRPVPAAAMIHVFRQRRAHAVRDLTWFFSGINNGIDALDTLALIKGTAKLHSMLAVAVRKKKAEAGNTGIAGQLTKILGDDGAITRVDENFWRGAAITYLGTDEGIDLINSDRPSENLLAFIEFLYREISIALGLPIEVVYNMASLGGATGRAALEDAQWLFDMVQDKIVERHSQRYYVHDTAAAIRAGDIRECADPEWWACAWRGPAKLTVDLGRSADAAVKLMKNAALSHVRYYDERAQDAYAEMEEEIAFRKWLKERCETAGVDYRELIEPTPGSVTTVNMPEQQPATA